MGEAFVSKDGRVPARSVAVYCSPSYLRPEPTGIATMIALACEDSPMDEDLTILTDSLSGETFRCGSTVTASSR